MSEHGHSPEDPLPKLLAEIDQALAIAPQLARIAFGYHAAFQKEGFSARESLYLVACQLHSDPGSP